jgi:hypothetical protein
MSPDLRFNKHDLKIYMGTQAEMLSVASARKCWLIRSLGDQLAEKSKEVRVRVTEVADDESRLLRPCSGMIQIEIGRARVRVEGAVDPETLRLVLERLGQ